MESDRQIEPVFGAGTRRLEADVEGIIIKDEVADSRLTGGLKTFDEIVAASARADWDYLQIPLETDILTYQSMSPAEQEAFKGVFGTLFRAESVVDEWMPAIVDAVPASDKYKPLKAALNGQAQEEAKHKASIARYGVEVLGLSGDLDKQAQAYNNYVAEALFSRFNGQMDKLLNHSHRNIEDLYKAIFIYGIISEDVVANSDVLLRRAKGSSIDHLDLPGMKRAQANVRKDEGRHVRIAHLASVEYLDQFASAEGELMSICEEYMNLADRMLGFAKSRSRLIGGIIDHYLSQAYGPKVDSLYYYEFNMTRFARRLDKLGLGAGAAEIYGRIRRSKTKYSDPATGEPRVKNPNQLALKYGPRALGYLASKGVLSGLA